MEFPFLILEPQLERRDEQEGAVALAPALAEAQVVLDYTPDDVLADLVRHLGPWHVRSRVDQRVAPPLGQSLERLISRALVLPAFGHLLPEFLPQQRLETVGRQQRRHVLFEPETGDLS